MEQHILDIVSVAVQAAVAPLQKELQELKAQANQQPADTPDMDAIWERKAKELGFIH